jgi:hypothetical protein
MLWTVPKQPVDHLDYDIDFARWLPEDDTITTATAISDAPTDLVIESVQISSPVVKVWVSGGTDGSTYKITVVASTSGGRIKETEFRIRVRER